jgi:hypothetical protein
MISQDGGALNRVCCPSDCVYYLRHVHRDVGVSDNKHSTEPHETPLKCMDNRPGATACDDTCIHSLVKDTNYQASLLSTRLIHRNTWQLNDIALAIQRDPHLGSTPQLPQINFIVLSCRGSCGGERKKLLRNLMFFE